MKPDRIVALCLCLLSIIESNNNNLIEECSECWLFSQDARFAKDFKFFLPDLIGIQLAKLLDDLWVLLQTVNDRQGMDSRYQKRKDPHSCSCLNQSFHSCDRSTLQDINFLKMYYGMKYTLVTRLTALKPVDIVCST